jgi:hypothetical protein
MTIFDGPVVVYKGPVEVCMLKREGSAKSAWILYNYYHMRNKEKEELVWRSIWENRRLKEGIIGNPPGLTK